MSERYEGTSERPSTYVPITGSSKPSWVGLLGSTESLSLLSRLFGPKKKFLIRFLQLLPAPFSTSAVGQPFFTHPHFFFRRNCGLFGMAYNLLIIASTLIDFIDSSISKMQVGNSLCIIRFAMTFFFFFAFSYTTKAICVRRE